MVGRGIAGPLVIPVIQSGFRKPGRLHTSLGSFLDHKHKWQSIILGHPRSVLPASLRKWQLHWLKGPSLAIKNKGEGGCQFPNIKSNFFTPGTSWCLCMFVTSPLRETDGSVWGFTCLPECRQPTSEMPSPRSHVARESGIWQESPGQGWNKTTPRKQISYPDIFI